MKIIATSEYDRLVKAEQTLNKLTASIENAEGKTPEEIIAAIEARLNIAPVEDKTEMLNAVQADLDASKKIITERDETISKHAEQMEEKENTIKKLENQIAKRAGTELPHAEVEKTDKVDEEKNEVWSESSKKAAQEAGLL